MVSAGLLTVVTKAIFLIGPVITTNEPPNLPLKDSGLGFAPTPLTQSQSAQSFFAMIRCPVICILSMRMCGGGKPKVCHLLTSTRDHETRCDLGFRVPGSR